MKLVPFRARVALGALLAVAGCQNNVRIGNSRDAGSPDLVLVFDDIDGGTDDAQTGPVNLCGDYDPGCLTGALGPGAGTPFPLAGDPQPDPNEKDQGVGRDPMGYIGLDQTHATFDFLWVANSDDWGRGTVSKINSKTVKEVARYFTVTCYSQMPPVGGTQKCDGFNGCCAADDYARFQARKAGAQPPLRQAVNITANSPSRTAVDFNGDVFVANRAFAGQSSVSKIANDRSECVDRNMNGQIDTSSDANGDGQITTDCNANGVPDDMNDVRATPCTNGGAEEFFGQDDECVLWTTNTNDSTKYGRPLALGQGAMDYGPSDVWAGTYLDGKFFRIDGGTALYKVEAQGPGHAYGAVVDAKGILWVAVLDDGGFGFIDTASPSMTGFTRKPASINGYGIAIDRDQNVWEGGWTSDSAFRYTPDRSNGFANLGKGYWTTFANPGRSAGATGHGRGIALDSRTPSTYYAWLARDGGWVVRLDASAVALPQGQDLVVDGSGFPAFRVAGTGTIGAGVDVDQNVWGISQSGSVATRAIIDKTGAITPPDIISPAAGGMACPAGDRCPLRDNMRTSPNPYTYSDFTGFGLRNFTNPKGSYSYVLKGCDGAVTDTQWYSLQWDADVPPNTSLSVRARTGNTPVPDSTWGAWTQSYTVSPADLRLGMPLQPFDKDNAYLQIEFIFNTQVKTSTPKLKAFTVAFKCGNIG